MDDADDGEQKGEQVNECKKRNLFDKEGEMRRKKSSRVHIGGSHSIYPSNHPSNHQTCFIHPVCVRSQTMLEAKQQQS